MAKEKTEARKRGRPPKDATLSGRIALRTAPEDIDQLSALGGKLPGFDPPTIARAALRLGLTVLELAPDLMVAGVGPARSRKAALKDYFKE